jgi:prophage regulatory protein
MEKQRQLPPTGFLRLSDIIGHRKKGIPALLPISRSAWYSGIQKGLYPPPVKLSERTSAWPVNLIIELIKRLED